MLECTIKVCPYSSYFKLEYLHCQTKEKIHKVCVCGSTRTEQSNKRIILKIVDKEKDQLEERKENSSHLPSTRLYLGLKKM